MHEFPLSKSWQVHTGTSPAVRFRTETIKQLLCINPAWLSWSRMPHAYFASRKVVVFRCLSGKQKTGCVLAQVRKSRCSWSSAKTNRSSWHEATVAQRNASIRVFEKSSLTSMENRFVMTWQFGKNCPHRKYAACCARKPLHAGP